MPDYSVKYIAHIDELRRPENFPHEVMNIGVYRVQNPEGLKEIINGELGAIIQNNGMIVQLDPASVFDQRKLNIRGRVYVPLAMITYIEAEVHNMGSSVPTLVETGDLTNGGEKAVELQDINGKKIIPS